MNWDDLWNLLKQPPVIAAIGAAIVTQLVGYFFIFRANLQNEYHKALDAAYIKWAALINEWMSIGLRTDEVEIALTKHRQEYDKLLKEGKIPPTDPDILERKEVIEKLRIEYNEMIDRSHDANLKLVEAESTLRVNETDEDAISRIDDMRKPAQAAQDIKNSLRRLFRPILDKLQEDFQKQQERQSEIKKAVDIVLAGRANRKRPLRKRILRSLRKGFSWITGKFRRTSRGELPKKRL